MYVTKHIGGLDREGIEVDFRGEDKDWVISD